MFRQTLIYQHKDTNGVFNQKVSSNKRPASPKCILQHVAGLTRWFLCFPRPADFGNDEKCPYPPGWFTAQPVELGRVDALVGDAVAARNMLGALGGSEITPNLLEKLVDFVFTVVDLAQMPQISQNYVWNGGPSDHAYLISSSFPFHQLHFVLGHQPSEASSGSAIEGCSMDRYPLVNVYK